ncbi:pectinesterase/pectinesterase inhibitor PPE8B-like [Malania oleifera]|uniref:pectinesterase/pectinesterase inhibitor PPE8B-like n=1 Tax=Malania oleifera TaxID=397392 RepID=UPI0025AE5D4D|nr:pectinesterase/pectinesterase inhibitor PPE8B-like [Malania oleifera]
METLAVIIMLIFKGAAQGGVGLPINVTVAQDGSGNYTKISDAVSAAPEHSRHQYNINIKAGIYSEYIEIGSKKTNLAFIGDGMEKTVITGNRSYGKGWKTFWSATVAINGHNCSAEKITIINSAGPNYRQAVALRSSSNFSTFYKCVFQGYQDTLYVHQGIQFYRDCEIYGTVDFVFGNARVVIQHSYFLGMQELSSNTVTYMFMNQLLTIQI